MERITNNITLKFLRKFSKEKQFYWKRNLSYSLLPIVLVLLSPVFINEWNSRDEKIEYNGIFAPETDVS
jgi:hypothetical protein